jgi:hypothetical protein
VESNTPLRYSKMIRDCERVGLTTTTMPISPADRFFSLPDRIASAAPTRAMILLLPERRPHRSSASLKPSAGKRSGSRPVQVRTVARSSSGIGRP